MNFYNRFKELISNIVDDTASIADRTEDTTHANKPSCTAIDTLPGGDQERRRAAETVEVEQVSRNRYQRSLDERRLEGDFEVGRDAIPLGVPKTFYDEDWNPPGHNMPGKSFRPLDTLNKKSAQAGGRSEYGRAPPGYSAWDSNSHAGGHSKLSTTASAGQNVTKRRDFADREAAEGTNLSSTSKRQKLNGGGNAQHTGDSMHYTEPFGEPVGIKRQNTVRAPLNVKAIKQSTRSGQDDPFSIGESRRNDADSGVGPKSKNARRNAARVGNGGSQTSRDLARRSSQGSVNGSSEYTSSSRRDNMSHTLDDEQRHFGYSSSRRGSHDHELNVPSIDLTQGFDEIHRRMPPRKPGKQGDASDMQGVANAFGRPRANVALERSTNDAPRASQLSQTNLRKHFKRDEEPQPMGPRSTARERMRPREGGFGHRTSSPDALMSAKTIQSPGPRNSVSQKVHTGTPARPLDTAAPRARRKLDQSPTQIYDDDLEIPIMAIYSKQCFEKAKDLSLVWDLQSKSYHVKRGDELVCLPNSDEPVAIGRKDITQWLTSPLSTKVCIKGPSTPFSTGKILIEFFDQPGVRACNAALCSSGPAISEQKHSPNRMNKIFENSWSDADEAHKKLCLTTSDTQPLMPQSRDAGSHRPETEEILYEDDQPAEASAPLKMLEAQRRRRENPTSSETISRYFDDTEAPRKSGRVSRAPTSKPKSPTPPPKWTDENELPAWPSMVYPSQGVRRVTVGREDIKRLDEEEFLNDNLVSFAMRHIEENMDPKHKDKVYCFNTFFYTTLNRKKGKNRLDYQAVERWTKGVDLFSKDYVVVPINAHLHWFVAIICNLPNLERKLAEADEDDGTGRDDQTSRIEPTQTELEITGSRSVPKAVTRVEMDDEQPDFGPDNDDRKSDVYEFDERGNVRSAHPEETLEPCPPTIKKGGKKSRPAPPARKYDVNQPVIITLDSLGAAHSTEIRVLKEYISAEAHGKRGMDVDVSQLSGITAKGIPEQPNYCDCGVFVVGYLKEFAKDPDKFIHKILRKEMKHEDFSDFKAPQTRNEIRRNILELGDEQQRQRLLHKQAKKATKTKASSPDAGSHKPSNSHPASSALPTLDFPPRQATPSSAVVEPPTTPCRSPAQTSPSKPVEADNDHLDFSPPKVLAGPQTRQESRPLPWNDNEDEDMLDHGGMSSALPDAPHSDRSSSTTTNSGSKSSLLDTFKNDIKEAGEAAHRNAVAAAQHERKPTLANDSQEEPEPEIAESQESHTG
ncbi:unnamed protein product [Zymoseptoria tritici ST99CH_1A5]|uniref:Ubiquitin-like protease family profile domain-containing protein n=1 Tax=Zymoseptoria tritici ST99CH_1A5 TaxID=1276529 RepID=A0A1Y6LUD2_ZYMTR|nr:unnamed protein product [Zymoseptoria tritici ST99CH_1A5]